MNERESFPDEVPVADAVEQLRPASEPSPEQSPMVPGDAGGAPLESNETDWHEQSQTVEDPDEDEPR